MIFTEFPEQFHKTLFEPHMLEIWGDRVVAKSGCATEGFLRDVNPLNAKIPLDKLIQDIQHLIQKSYHITSTITTSTRENSFIIIDNIVLPSSFSVTSAKLLLLYSFPMLKKPTEIINLVNLMNANDNRGLVEANEIFDPLTGNFVQAHKENDHYVQEGGEDLLRRKLNGYVSFLRSETPYTHALRLYPVAFAPDRTFRENTTLYESITNLFSSTAAHHPLDYPTLQIDGSPYTKSILDHLYLTTLGTEQEKVYHKILKKTGSGASLLPLLEAITMTYPPLLLEDSIPGFSSSFGGC